MTSSAGRWERRLTALETAVDERVLVRQAEQRAAQTGRPVDVVLRDLRRIRRRVRALKAEHLPPGELLSFENLHLVATPLAIEEGLDPEELLQKAEQLARDMLAQGERDA